MIVVSRYVYKGGQNQYAKKIPVKALPIRLESASPVFRLMVRPKAGPAYLRYAARLSRCTLYTYSYTSGPAWWE